MKEALIKCGRMSLSRFNRSGSFLIVSERFAWNSEAKLNDGRGVTYDKDLNAEHEVYGYVIRHHRRTPNSQIEKKGA